MERPDSLPNLAEKLVEDIWKKSESCVDKHLESTEEICKTKEKDF